MDICTYKDEQLYVNYEQQITAQKNIMYIDKQVGRYAVKRFVIINAIFSVYD